MADTGFLASLEETLLSKFALPSLTPAQFKVVKISDTEYDMGLSIPAVGTQHMRISIVGTSFTIKGSFNVIADDAQWPFTLIAMVVNNAVENFIKSGLDATVTPVATVVTTKPLKLATPVVLLDSSTDQPIAV